MMPEIIRSEVAWAKLTVAMAARVATANLDIMLFVVVPCVCRMWYHTEVVVSHGEMVRKG